MAGFIDTRELIPEAQASGMPDNYERIQASPDAFGANFGHALEQTGNQLSQSAQFFGQVQADDANNQTMQFGEKLKYGDPNDPNDRGYFGLQGADALSARQGVFDKFNSFLAQKREQLSPYARLQYDQMSRRYLSFFTSALGAHANQQAQSFTNETNKAASDINLNAIGAASATAEPDQQIIDFHTDRLVDARVKAAQMQGAKPGDPMWTEAVTGAKRDAIKAQVISMAATPEGAAAAQKYLNAHKADAGDLYGQLSAHVKAQASQYTVDQGVADATHQAATEGNVTAPPGGYIAHDSKGNPVAVNKDGVAVASPASATAAPGNSPSAGMLKHYEGFRSNAYWDVDHWRVGFGSDTYTDANGGVHGVTQNTIVSPQDAERDLTRRIGETQSKIVTQVSPQAWGALPRNTQAALTSMAYNYGMLPFDVTAAVRGGGGPAAISAAIMNHRGDNGGVNSKRRMEEATVANGGAIPSGLPFVTPGARPGEAPLPHDFEMFAPQEQPAVAPASPASTEFAPPQALAPQPAVYVQADQTSPAFFAPMNDNLRAMSVAARAMQIWGSRTDITPEQRESGFVKLRQNLQQAQFAAEATQQAMKQRSNEAAKAYIPRIVGGDATAVADIARDPNIEFPTQMELLRMARERGVDTSGMGPGYNDALKRIALPHGDPNRISNYDQLLRMRNDGDLSDAGLSKVGADMGKLRQQDFQGVVQAKSAMLDNIKRYMWYGEDGNLPGALKDPKGQQAYDKFVVAFESEFDQRVAAGKDPFELLKDEKGLKALADSIRSPEDKRMDMIREQGGNQQLHYDAASANATAPPPPGKVDQGTWDKIIDMRPTIQTDQGPQKLRKDAWGSFLTLVAQQDQPTQTALLNSFKTRFPGADLDTPFAMLLSARGEAPSAAPTRQFPEPTAAEAPLTDEQLKGLEIYEQAVSHPERGFPEVTIGAPQFGNIVNPEFWRDLEALRKMGLSTEEIRARLTRQIHRVSGQ